MSAFDNSPSPQTTVENITNGTFSDFVSTGEAGEIVRRSTDAIIQSDVGLPDIIDNPEYYIPIQDGSVNIYHYEGTGFVDAPTTSTTAIQKVNPAGPINPYNSNVTNIQRGKITQAYNTSVDSTTGKITISGQPASGGLGSSAVYFLGEVNQAVAATQVGIMLGKGIDRALYNSNPEFFDSIGMSSLNPETWSSITHGDTSLGATLFNMILGIDPETGNTQAYLSEDSFGYLAKWLQTQGVFETSIIPKYDNFDNVTTIGVGDFITGTVFSLCNALGLPINWDSYYPSHDKDKPAVVGRNDNQPVVLFNNDNIPFTISDKTITTRYNDGVRAKLSGSPFSSGLNRFYHTRPEYPASPFWNSDVVVSSLTAGDLSGKGVAALVGTIGSADIEGITNQEDASIPDVTNWNDIPSTIESLKTQYPNLVDDSVTFDQLQPDGTLKPTIYYPVGFPSTAPNPWTDTQPTTTNSPTTQANPLINIFSLPTPDISPIVQTVTNTPTPSPTGTGTTSAPTVPANPSDTGSGSSPTPIPSTGDASALWSVYHPTQGQVNSFGAWLWSADIITQIQQILQNPMDGIITLHKVFAPPIDSGNGSIVVGRLDSGVGSATVNQQYVTVDCGSVNCYEYFGNVFDYDPYTKISLYLPFIGIVPLNTDDIMRGTVGVKYGVDIFTGACLAMVSIVRDGNTVNMYQYSGMCSVEYPLTGAVHSGLVNGLLGVAGGIASIASGGIMAGASAVIGGALAANKTNISHSSGFSGNAGAMGIKKPYLIIERPQTKIAETFASLQGYPTNYSTKLKNCSGQVNVSSVHVSGINATDNELSQIESLLKSGVIV